MTFLLGLLVLVCFVGLCIALGFVASLLDPSLHGPDAYFSAGLTIVGVLLLLGVLPFAVGHAVMMEVLK
jgi:hypothetical protein